MTTAARPTFDTAKGGSGKSENDLGALSKQYSSRDLPSHTKLKYRQEGQNTSNELKNRDFRRELEEKERQNRDKKDRSSLRDVSAITSSSNAIKKSRSELPISNLDADDPVDADDDEEDDDDEDDAAMLMAELAKIKKERAAEMARKEAERKAEEEKIRMENIIKGNPLLNQERLATDFKVKRRWDDDVVFKNCSRGELDKKEKRFINDTLRSDFHRKFMEKYIK